MKTFKVSTDHDNPITVCQPNTLTIILAPKIKNILRTNNPIALKDSFFCKVNSPIYMFVTVNLKILTATMVTASTDNDTPMINRDGNSGIVGVTVGVTSGVVVGLIVLDGSGVGSTVGVGVSGDGKLHPAFGSVWNPWA